MSLSSREVDCLNISLAAMVARRRLERGVKLNLPEAIALIQDSVLEMARDGASLLEIQKQAAIVLADVTVMDGVEPMLKHLRLEVTLDGGTQVVDVLQPLMISAPPESGKERMVPGKISFADGDIEINEGRHTIEIDVRNSGDVPIFVGSHMHFAEVNPELDFDRESARNRRPDILAGTMVMWEPGERRAIRLVLREGQ